MLCAATVGQGMFRRYITLDFSVNISSLQLSLSLSLNVSQRSGADTDGQWGSTHGVHRRAGRMSKGTSDGGSGSQWEHDAENG